MRFNVRFLLLVAMPYVAGLGAIWVFANSIDASMHKTELQSDLPVAFRLQFWLVYTGLLLVGTLCFFLARSVIRKWRAE